MTQNLTYFNDSFVIETALKKPGATNKHIITWYEKNLHEKCHLV